MLLSIRSTKQSIHMGNTNAVPSLSCHNIPMSIEAASVAAARTHGHLPPLSSVRSIISINSTCASWAHHSGMMANVSSLIFLHHICICIETL